jgi:hypothetical protein
MLPVIGVGYVMSKIKPKRRTKMGVGDYGNEEKPGEGEFNLEDVKVLIQKVKDLLAKLEAMVGIK